MRAAPAFNGLTILSATSLCRTRDEWLIENISPFVAMLAFYVKAYQQLLQYTGKYCNKWKHCYEKGLKKVR